MASEESIVLGTDMAAPLQLNSATGPLVLDSVTWGMPKKKPRFIEGTDGSLLVEDEMAYENAEAVAAVRVVPQASFDLARAQHATLVQMLQEAERRGDPGLPCSYTPANGTTTWTWYLLLGEVDELPVNHESGYFAGSPVLSVRMTRKPALYAPWVTTVTDAFSSDTIANYTFDAGGGSAVAYDATVLANASLVSYWRLGEASGTNADDAKGSNDGTYTGGVTLGTTGALSGDANTAATFDGINDYVNVPHAANLAITGDLTLEAWVKPTDRAAYYWIVGKTAVGSARPYEWRIKATTGEPEFAYGPTGPEVLAGTNPIPTGVWSHVAVVRSGTTVTHYLNGVANGSGSVTLPTDGGGALRIGTRDDLFTYFKGGIDEVAVYNAALSAAAIAANYNASAGGVSLAVSGGQLVPSSTAEKVLYYSATALDLYDAQATLKLTTGASVAAGTVGLMLRRLDASNFLHLAVTFAGAATKLEIYKKDGGAFTLLASGAVFTPTVATSYWIRGRADGNVLTVEWFTAVPTATSTPAQTATYTLAGADATKFGAGIAGDVGLRTNLVPTDWRYDDLEIVPNVWVAAAPQVTGKLYGVPGDLPADGILKVTDGAGQARRFEEWGLEQRYAAEQRAANGGVDPPLLIDSDDLVTAGFSGTGTTRAGAYDPNASGNNVIRSTLTTSPTAVCGTGDLKHIGTFRVRARVWASSASVRVRLSYQDGDGPFRANSYATPAVVGAFARVDLGLITVEQATSGTQRWQGRVEAYGVAGDTVDIDELELVPAGEGYGKARAAYSYTAGVLSGYDDFTSLTAGTALNGRVAPSGGTWATSGVATDLAGKAATGTSVTRSTISDASPRFAILGSTNFTDVEVAATVGGDQAPIVTIEWRVIARWTDANNYLALLITNAGTISLVKVVAGVATTLASAPVGVTGPFSMQARLVVFASGVVIGHVTGTLAADLITSDSALATGGTLATGKPGFADRYSGSTVATVREYDNFSVAIPAAEPIAIYSGQSLEVRTDATKRLNSAGTIEGPAPSYFGSRFKVPPAGAAERVSRVAVSARRNDVDTADDAGVTDATRVQVSTRSKYLVPR